MLKLRRSLAVLIAVLTLIVSLTTATVVETSTAAAASSLGTGAVDAYGDSLLDQVQSELQFQLGLNQIDLTVHAFGGTALCDWIPIIESRVDAGDTALVVIEFSGDAFTPCMAGVSTEAELLAKYQSDLTYIATWLHDRGVPLLVVGQPPAIQPTGGPIVIPTTWSVGQIPQGYAPSAPAFNDMYESTVSGFQQQGWNIGYVAADSAVAAPNGNWTYVLPCLSFETAAMGCNAQGLIEVRSPNFAHFCPVQGVEPCPVWSSGAWRYATAISSDVSSLLVPTEGYRLTASDGGVFPFGPGAQFYGSMGAAHLSQPVVGIATDPATGGYWLVASDGGVFAFNAPFYGSTGAIALREPIVGITAAPDGGGYWLVASDGGVFAFGPSAQFYGSTGGITLSKPVVGIAAAPDGSGYWLVASDGGVFAFGPGAQYFGSTGGITLNKPVVGLAPDSVTGGYWLVASDGGVFAFNAVFQGSTGGITLNKPIVGIAADSVTSGYWLVASDGGVFAFHAPYLGSTGGITLSKPVVGASA
jgi:hypothetical protein